MDPETMKKLPHRNEGGMVKIGDKSDGGITDLIPLDTFGIVAITKKNIWRIMLADNIDPKRNTANIPRHTQECLLAYGSDDSIVGRTLLQGKEFFLTDHLPDSVDKQEGMHLTLSFTKELAAMSDEIKSLTMEHEEIKRKFDGKLKEDGSLMLPVLKNFERRMKERIQNIDHMGGVVIDILELFPTPINKKDPLKKLIEQTQQKFGMNHKAVDVLVKLKEKMKWLRDLRSDMEHPDKSGVVTFENYRMNESGNIETPLIKHTRTQSPFQSVDAIQFLKESQEIITDLFETVLALMCDFYAKDFAGDKVFVRNTQDQERTEANPHMNYRYDVLWTK